MKNTVSYTIALPSTGNTRPTVKGQKNYQSISADALQQKQTKYVVNDLVYLIALLRHTVLDLECNSNVVGTQ